MKKIGSNITPERLLPYSKPGPRYTSYPTAPVFEEGYSEMRYRLSLSDKSRSDVPLSLYFHIPFCSSVCFYCGCSVIYTKNRSRATRYLELLNKEMEIISEEVDPVRKVSQIHYGGGTPTFLNAEEMLSLWNNIKRSFTIAPDAEISVELDPRVTGTEHLEALEACGFNRASLGVQDLNEDVQRAINRIQPFEMSANLVRELRRRNFRGVNLDLIYGLPLQTVESFDESLKRSLELRPDRVSLFNFAYLPHLKKHQQRINEADLPDTNTRLEIFSRSLETFEKEGYVYIGMDHFALPDDELALAQKENKLHRNFQGYTTRGNTDLIGIGLTSIGEVNGAYVQNQKEMKHYEEALELGHLPVWRGFELSQDDIIRRRVIKELICHFELNMRSFGLEEGIEFEPYFYQELDALREFSDAGFLEVKGELLKITDAGRFVVRNICMVFDAYLNGLRAEGQKFSKTL